MGAKRSWLIGQFFLETILTIFVSLIISLVWVEALMPYFNDFTGNNLSLNALNFKIVSGIYLILFILTAVFTGTYPAWQQSSFNPIDAVSKKGRKISGSGTLRKNLVVFQFIIAITLISGVGLINQQLNYVNNTDLGFDAKSKVVVKMNNKESQNQFTLFKQKVSELAFVAGVSGVSAAPGQEIWDDKILYTQGLNSEAGILTKYNYSDFHYMDLMDISLLAGRGFSESSTEAEIPAIIINQMAMNELGFNIQNAIGQPVYANFFGEIQKFEIIGVMNDFHHMSLHQKIMPMALQQSPYNGYNSLLISIKNGQESLAMTDISKLWKSLVPNAPFEFQFLDQQLKSHYTADEATSGIVLFFTILAVLISCMGIYGLSLFSVSKRIKEIGIRKVLGASISEIVLLLSGNYLKLVGIAFCVSLPLAYFGIKQWLMNFSYQTPIHWEVFIIAGIIAMVLTLITISFESLKAALTNPVNSLKDE